MATKITRVKSHARRGTRGVHEHSRYYVDANDARTESINRNGQLEGRYKKGDSTNKDSSFVIRNSNGEIVGRAKAFPIKEGKIKYPRTTTVHVGGKTINEVPVRR
jgi:hypothetical protein